MTHPVKRGQFADDAANKLGIDSALMRQELKQAAAQRVASIPTHRAEPLTETERILLRALVLPEDEPARVIASTRLAEHPEWIADLATADLLDTLANAPAPENPLDAAATTDARAHLAIALDHTPQPNDASLVDQVEGALYTLGRRRDERRQRELRSQIAEADRRGDSEMLNKLIAEKILIDRKLRDN
jgi:DNA primase